MPAIYDLAWSGLLALGLFAIVRFFWRRAARKNN